LKGPPLKVEGKEGYYLTKDGEVGDYFIETYGQVHRPTNSGTASGATPRPPPIGNWPNWGSRRELPGSTSL
jgi:hypothetical protein